MQIEVARYRVQAAVKTQVCIERAHELGVLLTIGQRAEDSIGELADVALGPTEHEAVRAEVLEHRDRTVAMHRAAEDDGLLRLEEREVRAGRPAFRTADARRETNVVVRPRDTRAERLSMGTRVDRAGELAQRGDNAGTRADDPRVGDELGDRHPKTRHPCGVP
jgi:hypothetical protein